MSKPSDTPFPPFIEAEYANPRLAVCLKCLLYSQIRIDVDPHIMEGKHWITQVKALIKDHYLNWQQHHSDHPALNGYTFFYEGRSFHSLCNFNSGRYWRCGTESSFDQSLCRCKAFV